MVNLRVGCAAAQDVTNQQHMAAVPGLCVALSVVVNGGFNHVRLGQYSTSLLLVSSSYPVLMLGVVFFFLQCCG